MKKQEERPKEFRKMSTGQKKETPSPKKKPEKQPVTKEKLKPAQAVTITLLVLVILFMGVLVFLFFQPRRIQFWQNPTAVSREDSSLPDVQRLVPEEEPIPEAAVIPTVPEPEKTLEPPAAEEETDKENRTREARLFFVKVNTEGQITLKGLTRDITHTGSPLTQTINTLLKGPSSDEINKGSLTLVPDGTRLLSARVEGNTAYLNFNEAFRFNSLGREGYIAQLKQIVYTATEFSNIDQVQILIEGSQKEYLGGEGMFVGEPLSRESFQSLP